MQQELFFRYWTRKEAHIKAVGAGLSTSLKELDVSFDHEEPDFSSFSQVMLDDAQWCFVDMLPAPDYQAALVVEGRSVSPKYWEG